MKQSDKQPTQTADRRSFLKLAGAGAVTGAVAVAADTANAAPVEAKPEDAAGYRETAHVKRYYDLARF